MVKIISKDTRVSSVTSFRCRYCLPRTYFLTFSIVFDTNFEQINDFWVAKSLRNRAGACHSRKTSFFQVSEC